jgi:hypothetical protein
MTWDGRTAALHLTGLGLEAATWVESLFRDVDDELGTWVARKRLDAAAAIAEAAQALGRPPSDPDY